GPGESAETTGIWAISILGGSPRKLRDDAGRASVSPSGTQIAYIGGRSQSEIWIMGADGENPRKLLQAAPGDRFLQVQWSPAGNRIAYIKLHNDDEKSQTTIETVPVSGGVSATILAGPSLAGCSKITPNLQRDVLVVAACEETISSSTGCSAISHPPRECRRSIRCGGFD